MKDSTSSVVFMVTKNRIQVWLRQTQTGMDIKDAVLDLNATDKKTGTKRQFEEISRNNNNS